MMTRFSAKFGCISIHEPRGDFYQSGITTQASFCFQFSKIAVKKAPAPGQFAISPRKTRDYEINDL
ncbi:hypothetical protein Poly21_07720 [Allorhodopirellula heiligendammensis]|uniref:Uncharacterized protein n=1 Tax=Allorhodopirellula heiligendammensis TaxID=2714739 RepID=A0A5C6C399_9BACT|nr:hypothetical protein Poly21_07720 [Allorhodopirellula heiligendammensis]